MTTGVNRADQSLGHCLDNGNQPTLKEAAKVGDILQALVLDDPCLTLDDQGYIRLQRTAVQS